MIANKRIDIEAKNSLKRLKNNALSLLKYDLILGFFLAKLKFRFKDKRIKKL